MIIEVNNESEELKFGQIMFKSKICTYNHLNDTRISQKIILLSSGILFAKDNQLIFLDYKKYSRKIFNPESLKGKQIKKLGILQNDKFCVYCENDTYIYEFNKENYSIKEFNHVNVNLQYLIETKEHQFINCASEGI